MCKLGSLNEQTLVLKLGKALFKFFFEISWLNNSRTVQLFSKPKPLCYLRRNLRNVTKKHTEIPLLHKRGANVVEQSESSGLPFLTRYA